MSYSSHGTNPKITLITFTSNAEQSHVFQTNVKKFDVSARNDKSFTVAYLTSANFKKISTGGDYFEDFVKGPLELFITVPTATSGSSEIIEILEWESTD